MRAPSTSPLTTTQPVITIISVLAVVVESPWPRTRNGKPHSIENTVTENCEVKCDHMPSRVPGLPHTVRSDRPSARSLIRTTPRRRYGESLTSIATSTMSGTPIAAAQAKLRVQPSSCRARDSGAAATMAPSWPNCPVIWVISGAWRTRNHTAMSRITLTKTIASPAPSTARAPPPPGSWSRTRTRAGPRSSARDRSSSSLRDP